MVLKGRIRRYDILDAWRAFSFYLLGEINQILGISLTRHDGSNSEFPRALEEGTQYKGVDT